MKTADIAWKELLVAHLQKVVEVSIEEAETFASCFKLTAIKKGQYVVQPGFTAKYKNYVFKGAFRAYVIDDAGNDHTVSFAIEDWWISDYNSYIYQQPATMFVVALEDSLVLQLEYDKEQQLKSSHHRLETFFRIVAERGLAFHQRRIISNLMHSAEERYDYFLEKYPAIASRVPQYTLASYLGMTKQFLSRIRHKKGAKK